MGLSEVVHGQQGGTEFTGKKNSSRARRDVAVRKGVDLGFHGAAADMPAAPVVNDSAFGAA